MIIGVSFKIPQATDNTLWKILKCVEIPKYKWHNIESQNEVWESFQGGMFFKNELYNGNEFLRCIQSNYYIIFLKLQAYFPDGNFFDIHTYQEFQNSDCQLLLLIADCEFVDIYVKDQTVAKSIYKNAVLNQYGEVEYITEFNNSRTKMDVL